jgi:hypothetical protein
VLRLPHLTIDIGVFQRFPNLTFDDSHGMVFMENFSGCHHIRLRGKREELWSTTECQQSLSKALRERKHGQRQEIQIANQDGET